MWANYLLRKEAMAECLGKQPAFLVQEGPWNLISSTIYFRASKIFGTSLESNCNTELIRSGLSRFPTSAIGKASDKALLWLLCSD